MHDRGHDRPTTSRLVAGSRETEPRRPPRWSRFDRRSTGFGQNFLCRRPVRRQEWVSGCAGFVRRMACVGCWLTAGCNHYHQRLYHSGRSRAGIGMDCAGAVVTEANDASVSNGVSDSNSRIRRDRRGRDFALWRIPWCYDRVESNRFDRLAEFDALPGPNGPGVPPWSVSGRDSREVISRPTARGATHSEGRPLTMMVWSPRSWTSKPCSRSPVD